MCNSTLREEEIFFGFIHLDGSRGGLIRRQPTLQELQRLWSERPDLFEGTTCVCGQRNFIFRHVIKPLREDPGTVGASYIETFCPNCGKREKFGANFFRAKMRANFLDEYLSRE